MSSRTLDRIADGLGVSCEYAHAGGHRVTVSSDTRRKLVAALGFQAESEKDLEESYAAFESSEWRRMLPHVAILRENDTPRIPLSVRQGDESIRHIAVRFTEEGGSERTWDVRGADMPRGEVREIAGTSFERRFLDLPQRLPIGYHRLSLLSEDGGEEIESSVIVAPARCWLTPALADHSRVWGLSIQLYGLRSDRNWGIGDFTDLTRLVAIARTLGAGFVGVNPLHALFSERPDRCSPYSPNSRLFLNPLYIDPDDPAGVAGAEVLRESRDSSIGLVDYAAVTRRKMTRFRAVFDAVRAGKTPQARALSESLDGFVGGADARTRGFAVFEALREFKAHSGPTGSWSPWWRWSEDYRRPDSPAVAEFADRHRDRVAFHLFLQWLADRQLRAAADRARAALPLGIYGDMAVGFDRDGADAWMDQDVVPHGISVGCPPDLRNPMGQDWGVVPFSPIALRHAGYRPFIELLRANMRYYGVLRIDHAFQLLRLFWIPLGAGSREGGYVRYPMEDLLAIVALESHRNRCAVVAEDLGTIPRGFRERIIEWNTLSFRVLHRERNPDRSYAAPSTYPEMSTVAAGTHDQATLAGFWRGRDIEQRKRHGLYPSEDAATEASRTRPLDRKHLVDALSEHAGFSGGAEKADGTPSDDLVIAVHRFLARTPSRMMVVQPDDLIGELEQVNMPATVNGHSNWRRIYAVALEEFATHPLISEVAEMLRREGRSWKTGSRDNHRKVVM